MNRNAGAFAASGTLAGSVTPLPSATVTGPDLAHFGPFNPDVRPYIYTLTNYLSSNYSYDWKIVTVNAQPGMSHANANVLKVSDFDDVGINRVIVTVKSGGIPIAVGVKNVEVRWTGY